MKLNKVLSLMVAICLLFSLTSFAKFTDVTADAPYSEAVNALAVLGILDGYHEEGVVSFKPDGKITRAEFSKVIACAVGMGPAAGANQKGGIFTDVNADDWFSGYVAFASESGIVNGMGDGTFAPQAEVTYQQAVKMIVCAIGHSIRAENLGGWPTGYMMVASQEGITVGTKETAGGASRATVAQLVYRSLTVEMMDREDYSADGGFKKIANQSLLLSRLGVIKAEAKISSVPLDKTDRNITLAYNNIDKVAKADGWYINNVVTTASVQPLVNTILRNDVDVTGFQGYLVTALIDINDESEPKLLSVIPMAGKNKELIIKPSLLVNANNAGYVEYYKDITDDKTTKEKLEGTSTAVSVDTYVNLDKVTSYATTVVPANNVTSETEYKYVDTDNNGSYDTVIVSKIGSFVVGNISTSGYKIYRETSIPNTVASITKPYISLDPTDNTINYTLKNAEGKDLTLTDLKSGDVANVKESSNSNVTFYEIVISNATVSGNVSEISSEKNKAKVASGASATAAMETFYRIGDKDYQFFPGLAAPKAGDTIDALVAANGRILSYKLSATGTRNYGLVVANNVATDFGKTYQLQMVASDGNLNTYNFAKKVNGSSSDYIPTGNLDTNFKTDYPVGSLIAYELNTNGEIKNVQIAGGIFDGKDSVKAIDSSLSSVAISNEFRASSNRIGSYNFTENTSRLFTCEFDLAEIDGITKKIDKDSVVLSSTSSLEDEETYEGIAIVNTAKEIQAIFLYGAGNSINYNTYPMIITKTSTTTVDGDLRDKFTGYVNGEEITVTVAADESYKFVVNDVIFYTVNAAGELTNAAKIAGTNGTDYRVVTNSTATGIKDNNEKDKYAASGVALYATPYTMTGTTKNFVTPANAITSYTVDTTKHEVSSLPGYAFAGKVYEQTANNVEIIKNFAASFVTGGNGQRIYTDANTANFSVDTGAIAYIYNGKTGKVEVTSIAELETDVNTNDYSYTSSAPSTNFGRDNDDSIYVYNYDGDTKFILIIDADGE